jgi:hypothetical protein
MENPDPAPRKSGSIAAGIALVMLGLLVFVPSGLCTGVFVIGSIVQEMSHPGSSGMMSMGFVALVIGGPFVAGGAALLWFGIKEFIAYSRRQDGK